MKKPGVAFNPYTLGGAGKDEFVERRKLPRNLRPADQQLFGPSMTARFPSWSVNVLRDADVFGRSPIRTSDGEYVVDSFVDPSHCERWRQERGHWRASLERPFHALKRFDSKALWITDNWSCGYFHWFGDALPRLEIALREQRAEDLTLLLPYKFHREKYFLESLQPFGLKEVRVLGRFERLRCRELLLPTHVAVTGNFDSSVMRSLRGTLRSFADTLSSEPTFGRVYISRRQASRRRIANEDAIRSVLADHGFHTLVAEETPWPRQLQLSAAAKVLVSNHGAGLTNMLMMAAGSRVLEIREQQDAHLNCYFNMANAVDLDYYYLLARREKPDVSVHFADLVVDPNELDNTLSQMLTVDFLAESA